MGVLSFEETMLVQGIVDAGECLGIIWSADETVDFGDSVVLEEMMEDVDSHDSCCPCEKLMNC